MSSSVEELWKQIYQEELATIIDRFKLENKNGKDFTPLLYYHLCCKVCLLENRMLEIVKSAEAKEDVSAALVVSGDLKRYLWQWNPLRIENSSTLLPHLVFYVKSALWGNTRAFNQLAVSAIAEKFPIQATPFIWVSENDEKTQSRALLVKLCEGKIPGVPKQARKYVAAVCLHILRYLGKESVGMSVPEIKATEEKQEEWLGMGWKESVATLLVLSDLKKSSFSSELIRFCTTESSDRDALAALSVLDMHEAINVTAAIVLPGGHQIKLTSDLVLERHGNRSIDANRVSEPATIDISVAADDSAESSLVVVDGLNVALAHGEHSYFSVTGLRCALDALSCRGSDVLIVLPNPSQKHRKDKRPPSNIRELLPARKTVFVPPQDYDDSYALDIARRRGGRILSNDLYRDWILKQSDPIEAKRWVDKNVISFAFVGDEIVINPDFNW